MAGSRLYTRSAEAMTAIWIICWVDALWGLSLLLMPDIPRPFGGLESYMQYLPDRWVGVLFLIVSVLPVIAVNARPESYSFLAVSIIPQQLMLFWGAAWPLVVLVFDGWNARMWLGECYLIVLAMFHFLELGRIFELAGVGPAFTRKARSMFYRSERRDGS